MTPFATFIARFMLETMVGMIVGIILVLGLLWFGFDAIPADPLQVILGYSLLMLFSFLLVLYFVLFVT